MNPPPNNSVVELFRAELAVHVQTLKEGLLSLCQGFSIEKCVPLYAAASTMRSGSMIVHLEPLVNLTQAMTDIFSAAKDGKLVLIMDHISILLKAADELDELAKHTNIIQEVEKRTAILDNLTSLISKIYAVTGYVSEAPHVILPKPISTKEKPLRSIHELLDKRLLDQFSEQVAAQATVLRDTILHLEKTALLQKEDLFLFEKALTQIKAAAESVYLPTIGLLAEGMKKYLAAISQAKSKVKDEEIDLFLECSDLFKSVSQSKDLLLWIEENKEHVSNLLTRLKAESEEEKLPELGAEPVDITMLDLFRFELETQTASFNEELLALENDPKNKRIIESLMRSAHSIKGAARVVNLDSIVKLAHSMEDFSSLEMHMPSDI